VTLSLAALDPRTGAFGMVIASSSPAVASRCVHLRAGVGAVASQNITNPALGTRVLDLLGDGHAAADALRLAREQDPAPEYRQASVVDAAGRTAVYSGARTLGKFAAREAAGAVAAGNLLADVGVIDAMLGAFAATGARVVKPGFAVHGTTANPGSTICELEDRLLAALRAGMAAGGEEGPVRSAGLQVVDTVPWAVTDLRVDFHDDPVRELESLWALWRHQKADYLVRALNPAAAPVYSVPGDPEP
jgi:uncharacterized Ntn-hydrolase superfamily protein